MDPRISSSRDAAVAGQFYPGTVDELESTIAGMSKRGGSRETEAIGVMVPHAGYMYSGAVAGAVYSEVKLPRRFVILGPNHTGIGGRGSVMTSGVWKMPLGDVPVDDALAGEIIAGSSMLEDDATAHVFEHSIEVQLPFLQYLVGDFTFVPISLMVRDVESCRDIGTAVADAISRQKDPVLVVASSDMSHYESQQQAETKDRMALDRLLDLDPGGLLETVADNSISMCGAAPAASMLFAAIRLGAEDARLVKYQTSGDITGDMGQVVGYAGVVVS